MTPKDVARRESPGGHSRAGVVIPAALAIAAVALLAVNLRTGVSSLAPVLDQVAAALGVSTAAAGVLTAIPGLSFAVMGLAAVPLSRRCGITPTLVAGIAAIVLGLCVRPWVGSFPLFVILTIVVVAGIALANVLLPAWIKNTRTPARLVTLMAVYTTVLAGSGALGPLSALAFDGWEAVLGVWAIPAVVTLFVWVILWTKLGVDTPRSASAEQLPAEVTKGVELNPERPITQSPTAWALLGFFALQSSGAYVQMGWLPTILIDRGVEPNTASWALIMIGVVSVFGGSVMAWMAARLRNLVPVPIALSLITVAGWAGIYFAAAAAPLLWGVFLGIGGLCFPLVLALLAERTISPMVTARLSGFVQPGGYVVAGLIPFGIGMVYARLGDWDAILLGLMAMAAAMSLVGAAAARNITIDEELSRPRGA